MSFDHPILSLSHDKTLFHFFDADATRIQIHLNKTEAIDDARIAFVLHALARVVHGEDVANPARQSILSVYRTTLKRIESTQGDHLERGQNITRLTVYLFGMRIMELLGEEYDEIIDLFARESYTYVCSEPILMSLFLATYAECPHMRERVPYAQSLWFRSLHVYDFLLNSSVATQRLPFDFVDLSAIAGIPSHLVMKATSTVARMIDEGYMDTGSSSGIASCIEHFVRIGDDTRARRCLEVLEKRILARDNEYLSNEYGQDMYADSLFREHEHTQYVCLDTNAHLVLAQCTLWARDLTV